MCPAENVPAAIEVERDWRVLKVMGPFPLSTVGVMASFAEPLAAAKISLLAVATFETDYLLLKADTLERAIAVLTKAGHHRQRVDADTCSALLRTLKGCASRKRPGADGSASSRVGRPNCTR